MGVHIQSLIEMEHHKKLTFSLVISALFFTSLVRAGDITDLIHDCTKDEYATVKSVTMEGCDSMDDFCKAEVGGTAKGQISFLVGKSKIESLDCGLSAEDLGPIPVSFPCPQKDGFKSLTTGKCPLEKNTKAVYDIAMDIPNIHIPSIPTITGVWTLKDGKNTVICIKIPIKIVPKSNPVTTKSTPTPNKSTSIPTTVTPSTQDSTTSGSNITRAATVTLILTVITKLFAP